METLLWKLFGYLLCAFCEYLTYKEWKQFSFYCLFCHLFGKNDRKCKYLTYKEWKHSQLRHYATGSPLLAIVSTLPIRNGNRPASPSAPLPRAIVSTLPIRNGNYSSGFSSAIGKSFLAVSTLPIRNGNY